MFKNIIFCIFCIVFVCGCASAPLSIQVPDAAFISGSEYSLTSVASVVINNEAPRGKSVPGIMGVSSLFFFDVAPSTHITVEKDFEAFFQSRLAISPDAERSLVVTIRQAEAYWILPGSRNHVFGIFVVGADVPYEMRLNVLFEIEVNGKVSASYSYEEIIEIKSGSASRDQVKEGYQALMEAYRSQVFEEIAAKFVMRYL